MLKAGTKFGRGRLGGRVWAALVCASLVTMLSLPVSSAAGAVRVTQPGFTITKIANEPAGASNCDDLAYLNGNLFYGCQNLTNSAGGGGNSTLVEVTPSGSTVKTWSIPQKIDGMCADNKTHQLIVTFNEDANSLLRTVNPSTGQITTYAYSPNIHKPSANKLLYPGGGTDSCNVDAAGHILIVASHALFPTGTTVLVATLHPPSSSSGTGTATLKPTFADNATGTNALSGGSMKLSLTDADSSTIVPQSVPKFGGDYMVTDQTALLAVFAQNVFKGAGISVIKLATGLDDPQFATSNGGTLYIVNKVPAPSQGGTAGAPSLYKVTGPFTQGTLYATDDGISDEIVTVNLNTGKETPFVRGLVTTKGLIYVDANGTKSNLPLNGAAAVPVASSSGGGGLSTAAIVIIIVGGIALLLAAGLLVWRRQRPGPATT